MCVCGQGGWGVVCWGKEVVVTTLETAFSEKDLETSLENPMPLLSYFESSHFALLHINNRGLHIYAALLLIVQSLSSYKFPNSALVMCPCTRYSNLSDVTGHSFTRYSTLCSFLWLSFWVSKAGFNQQPWWCHWYWVPPCALTCLLYWALRNGTGFVALVKPPPTMGCLVLSFISWKGWSQSLSRWGRWPTCPPKKKPFSYLYECLFPTQAPCYLFLMVKMLSASWSWLPFSLKYCVSNSRIWNSYEISP